MTGTKGDYCDVEEKVNLSKVLQGLDRSEKAVINRISKLKERLEDPEKSIKIQRKVAQTMS